MKQCQIYALSIVFLGFSSLYAMEGSINDKSELLATTLPKINSLSHFHYAFDVSLNNILITQGFEAALLAGGKIIKRYIGNKKHPISSISQDGSMLVFYDSLGQSHAASVWKGGSADELLIKLEGRPQFLTISSRDASTLAVQYIGRSPIYVMDVSTREILMSVVPDLIQCQGIAISADGLELAMWGIEDNTNNESTAKRKIIIFSRLDQSSKSFYVDKAIANLAFDEKWIVYSHDQSNASTFYRIHR